MLYKIVCDYDQLVVFNKEHPDVLRARYASFISYSPFFEKARSLTEAQQEKSVELYCAGIQFVLDQFPHHEEYLPNHAKHVQEISVAIAEKLGLSKPERNVLYFGSYLHDLGKIRVRDEILEKEGRLTDEEWLDIKRHTHDGAAIEQPYSLFAGNETICAEYHQEKFNGQGYLGLSGENIPLYGRIVKIADVFSACKDKRPYTKQEGVAGEQKRLTEEQAAALILENKDNEFDPYIVEHGFRPLVQERNFMYSDTYSFYERFLQSVPQSTSPAQLVEHMIATHAGFMEMLVQLLDTDNGRNERGYEPYVAATIAAEFAKYLDLSFEQQRRIFLYALIGGIYDVYLPKKITDPYQMRAFAWNKSNEIYANIIPIRDALNVPLDIFENFDGLSGMRGKAGEDIDLEARVARVSLLYYQYSFSNNAGCVGLKKVQEACNTICDPQYVGAFMEFIKH